MRKLHTATYHIPILLADAIMTKRFPLQSSIKISVLFVKQLI